MSKQIIMLISSLVSLIFLSLILMLLIYTTLSSLFIFIAALFFAIVFVMELIALFRIRDNEERIIKLTKLNRILSTISFIIILVIIYLIVFHDYGGIVEWMPDRCETYLIDGIRCDDFLLEENNMKILLENYNNSIIIDGISTEVGNCFFLDHTYSSRSNNDAKENEFIIGDAIILEFECKKTKKERLVEHVLIDYTNLNESGYFYVEIGINLR